MISEARLADLERSMVEDRAMLNVRPLVAQYDGQVLMGNQRLIVAKKLGWETIPAIFVDLPPDKARLWALRDNNSFGEWDEPALAELLVGLAAEGVDLALTGFASADLDSLLAGIEVATDPDEAPLLPEGPPDSKLGGGLRTRAASAAVRRRNRRRRYRLAAG